MPDIAKQPTIEKAGDSITVYANTVKDATGTALVPLVDADGHLQIDVLSGAAGGGTQYTEGDIDATITGTAFLWEDASDTLRAVSSAKPLPTEIKLAIPAGTNNIGDVDVLTLPALPAGTNNIGDVDVLTLPALPAGTNNIGDVDVLTVPAPLSTSGGGTEATALRVTLANDSTGLVSVDDNGTTLSVDDGASTLTVDQATASNLNAQVVGELANDAVDSGNPLKIGGRGSNAEPTAISADGDRVNAWFDQVGRLVIAPFHPSELTPVTVTQTATADTSIIAAPGAGQSLYICSVLATNTSATLTRLDLKDGSGGTVRVTGALAASGGGFMWNPMRPWKLTANTALFAALSTSVTDVRLTIEYFTAP